MKQTQFHFNTGLTQHTYFLRNIVETHTSKGS